MTAAEAQSRQQVRLWSAAFGVSALVNLIVVLLIAVWISFRVILAVIQYAVLTALGFQPASMFGGGSVPPVPPPPMESVLTIVPEVVPAEVAVSPPKPEAMPFARTSKDQEAERPEKPSFMGERNTQARSDAPAVAEAPLNMPSQKGREPHYEGEVETTNSNYQDGDLASDHIAKPSAEPSIPSAPAPEPMKTPDASATTPSPESAATDPSVPAEAKAEAPETKAPPGPATPPVPPEPKEKFAQGTMPVERQVKEDEAPKEELPKPPVPERPQTSPAPAVAETLPQPKAKPQSSAASPADSPGFRGNQQKTRLMGSITRQGGSALDVEDSLLGRYHSAISRAVEKEWQLNCVRNRDYITPGQIVVRFVLEPSGKVRSLSFVEEFGVGNIQKGFTSESIRTAAIPAFPAELKKQLNGDPLELTYSFTF